MRLIDADALVYPLKMQADSFRRIGERVRADVLDDCIVEIGEQPTVDAAPVVRCKDCKHYNAECCLDGYGWCERSGHDHVCSDDWFCADGERADSTTCGEDYCEIEGE